MKQTFGPKDEDATRSFAAYSKQGLARNPGESMYEWRFKCIKDGWNDMIGIISCLDDIHIINYPFESKYDSYVWWKGEQVYNRTEQYDDLKGRWRAGDTIKLILDCDRWILTFLKNDQLFNTVKLMNKNDESVFYPIIFARDGYAKYEHIV